ncbi:MAG TPA: putative sulfate exporter family transporter [Thermodesulfobacteriota bacterium]|nr:putative sulfate exporter family transporter [Thermodesulfobacteriota bacterium]
MANGVAITNEAALTRKISMWSALPTFRQSLPGLLALVIIAIICGVPGIPWPYTIETLLKYIDAVLPPIYGKGLFIDLLHFNYVVIGLAAGILIRNVVGVPKSWEAGLSYTGVFMNVGIILLGSQYMLSDLAKLGVISVLLMIVMVFGGALVFTLFGRYFRLGNSLTALLSAAFSMCGVSACVAIAPMVRAKSEEVAYAIAVSVTFGFACLFGLPVFGRLLELSNYAFGLLCAAGVPNSNQVIATGFNFSFAAGKVAGFANIGRVVLIPAGVLFVYFMTLTREFRESKINVWQVTKDKFPIFILGFIVVWIGNCLHLWPVPASEAMEKVMNWFFTLCFVGLGLQTKLGDMKKAGLKGILIGYGAGLIRVGICLAIILILTKANMVK